MKKAAKKAAVKKTAVKTTAVKTTAVKKAAPRKAVGGARRSTRKPLAVPAGTTTSLWGVCVAAIEAKKGTRIRVLDLRPVTTFADYFVLASGGNARQVQAIADEVTRAMREAGDPPNSVEGYENAEWVLVDFGDMVVHVFTEKAREYYELDRLWRDAPEVRIPSAG